MGLAVAALAWLATGQALQVFGVARALRGDRGRGAIDVTQIIGGPSDF